MNTTFHDHECCTLLGEMFDQGLRSIYTVCFVHKFVCLGLDRFYTNFKKSQYCVYYIRILSCVVSKMEITRVKLVNIFNQVPHQSACSLHKQGYDV